MTVSPVVYPYWQIDPAKVVAEHPDLWGRSQLFMHALHEGQFRGDTARFMRRAFPGGPIDPPELAKGMGQTNAMWIAAKRWFMGSEATNAYEKRDAVFDALLDLAERMVHAVHYTGNAAWTARSHVEPLAVWLQAADNPLRAMSPELAAQVDNFVGQFYASPPAPAPPFGGLREMLGVAHLVP